MANTPDYSWPPMDNRKVMGKPYKRLDGPQKASGPRQVLLRHQTAGTCCLPPT